MVCYKHSSLLLSKQSAIPFGYGIEASFFDTMYPKDNSFPLRKNYKDVHCRLICDVRELESNWMFITMQVDRLTVMDTYLIGKGKSQKQQFRETHSNMYKSEKHSSW